MARPPKFTTDEILDAAAHAAATRGREATIADVAHRVGAPIGSLYHRFSTRDELFVSLWLRSVRRFHVALLEAAALPDTQEALVRCAVHIPRFCREHPLDALALTLYRQSDLIASGPESLREDVSHINDDLFSALGDLARRRYPQGNDWHVNLMSLAVTENPYGLVRRHLRHGERIPDWLDDAVIASTTAILALGDRDTTWA